MAIDVDACYRTYGPMVLRRCRRLLRDEERAVDAMHDVFVQLLRNEHRLDGTAPSSLLLQIATNVCLNRIRTGRRHPEHPEDELLQELAAGADDAEGQSLARRILGRIFGAEPPSTGVIAVLHLVDGLTLEEVAREVGMSVSGVRKRLRTLRARANAAAVGG